MNKLTSRAQAGQRGEALARAFLEHAGYRYLDSNFVRRVGELDLVMLEPAGADGRRTIVFIEVRYRSRADFGGALSSVDWKKQRKLLRVSSLWLQRHACSRANARIDVIAIEPLHESSLGAEQQAYVWSNHHVLWIKSAIETG